MIISQFVFGDTALYYVTTRFSDEDSVGLVVLPKSRQFNDKNVFPDPLIQVAFAGDRSLVDYSRGVTMKNREATVLSLTEQRAEGDGVITRLSDGKGNFYTHTVRYFASTATFSVQTEYENASRETRTLEFFDSVCVGVVPCGATADMTLHRMTSAWSRECRLKSERFSALGLEESWANYGLKNEKWGQAGSMSNRGYYPFAALEDTDGTVLGMTMEAPCSWQMEVGTERENNVSLSGGMGDYESAHWRKKIAPQEKFTSHKAYFCVRAEGGVNAVCNALVHTQDALLQVPASEESMPVLFNEYCTTWGCPSEENIQSILDAISSFPVGVFVIDCGWFKRNGVHWSVSGGDWQESRSLFPHGVKAVAASIRARGMLPGIWFEYEVAARESALYQKEELLLRRDGTVITGKNRRFLDLRKPEVQAYLKERVVDFLKTNGFEYLKIDYNDSIGIGCDGAESLGEGARQVAEESIAYLQTLRRAIPSLVIENCASGGSRIEPLRMSMVSQCSFSDAHECKEIPFVAANVSRVVPARQIQVWATIRRDDGVSRIIYSLCAAMMGRICLSGDVCGLSEKQRACIRNGLAFYEEAKEIVRYGDITRLDCSVTSYRRADGVQVYEKRYRGNTLLLVHFGASGGYAEAELAGNLTGAYTDREYTVQENKIKICGKPFTAGAFLIKQRG